ncbi:DUF2835 domain-containing protein [Simiduia sp. 21SJ11W-1]|uniref:DUF2835 family protein n=1 Tax=Simiduia sp. 21SJ11W-1 TaxID=2909669 RepID=UPI00209F1C6A|nr:DUF2835 family protein [Simiduia sp. 21SJ11W-1]UTA49364.1 DUF2835 domain-containing protein [Simiduia sp. 21SJ11W-1]
MGGQVEVQLAISRDELLRLYRGSARVVSAVAVDGRRIRFPADALRRLVTDKGVYGRFAIEFDDANRLIAVRPL